MPSSVRLSEAVDEYIQSVTSRGQSAATIKCKRSALLRFLATTGNIYPKNISVKHVDMWLSENGHWLPSTRRVNIRYLSDFQNWMATRKYIPRDHDFLEGLRKVKVPKRRRPRVAVDNFEQFLDEAPSERDRIIIALGLHLLVRLSEMVPIQWKHLYANPGYVQIYRTKTGTYDDLPISGDLEVELDTWRRHVCKTMGVTQPDPEWYVVCQLRRSAVKNEKGHFMPDRSVRHLVPEEKLKDPGLRVKPILAKIGVTERGARMHVLRRSGSVATRDYLQDEAGEGRDKALMIVQSMLGHADQGTTQIYLDDEADRNTRNALLKGKFLYRRDKQDDAGNVVDFTRRRGVSGGGEGRPAM